MRSIPHKRSDRRMTVAYFSSSPGGIWSFEKWLMWRGIAEAIREWGINFIYVSGEEFEREPQAALYRLIDSGNVDGIIFWNSFFCVRSQNEAIRTFLNRFEPLPMVSIERELPGCSNILVDNTQGINDLVKHLSEKHQHSKIAFIGQNENQTSELRRLAFVEATTRLGIYNEDLVGELSDLDRRGLVPGRDYQAIVALSDWEAILLTQQLRLRGLSLPQDMAITGFNDGMDARGSQPALTTIRMPFRSMGRQAVEMLVNRINGRESPITIWKPLQLILRRSCGCLEPMAEQAGIAPVTPMPGSLSEVLPVRKSTILAEMALGMGTSIDTMAHAWAEKLLDIFLSGLLSSSKETDLLGPTDYLHELNDLLQWALKEGSNVSRWHEALTTLRRQVLPYLDREQRGIAESLWQQARVLIGQTALRSEINRGWEAAQRSEILRDLETELLVASSFPELLDILVRALPRLQIADFYLVLYEDPDKPDEQGRLLLAIHKGVRVDTDPTGEVFPTKSILPGKNLSVSEPYSLVIEALHLAEDQVGYLVFKTNPPENASMCDVFQSLRILVTSAVKEVRLRQALKEALQQAEEANQLKSQFLSMVSHELRTPLNLIVGLSEMALRRQTRNKKASLEATQKYLEQIYISGQHLDRLIRDVLDLASSQVGQMKLFFEALDLKPILTDAACMAGQLAQQKNLNLIVNIEENLPHIRGDKTRLRQVLLNLLSNAIKFTARGEVSLSAGVSDSSILVTISDTGLGIPCKEQIRIFDEFYQAPLSSSLGYGGMGLGLAITRRLIEKHGGKIWVESAGIEGKGATFYFMLPVIDEIQQVNAMKAMDHDAILVLTEDPDDSRPLTSQLTDHGFSIQVMRLDQEELYLSNLSTSPPGAVILDLAPASELGWQIIKQLKENPNTQDIPVLFYSLVTEQETGSVIEFDYLTKPVNAETLLNTLQRYGLKGASGSKVFSVLIIDDEPGILDLHATMIQSQMKNCRVITASNGRQGLEIMRGQRPDLVLLDLMMPEIDGFSVLNRMQEEQMLRNIPVIILTAQLLTEKEMLRLNQGVTAVLGKGIFSQKEMMTRVEMILSRSKRLGSESQRLVQRSMAYIHENYPQPIARADIAEHLNVNEQYLSRCFKNEIGVGPMTYLSRFRIERAKRLLEEESLSITQIALEVGLSSQSYFSRIFLREVGVSPSDYRKGIRSSR
jgi:signal transduction histidine kinase/DNA-binding LacI/PurR family transcriptional regulator/DNA-binding response OmpR family regulator